MKGTTYCPCPGLVFFCEQSNISRAGSVSCSCVALWGCSYLPLEHRVVGAAATGAFLSVIVALRRERR